MFNRAGTITLPANKNAQADATNAGAALIAAPGAGLRIRVLAVAMAGTATGAAGTTYVSIRGTQQGGAIDLLRIAIVGALTFTGSMAMPVNILLDENTGLTATVGGADFATGKVSCTVAYRTEAGTGVAP